MSRFSARLAELQARQDPKRLAERESHLAAGDGLELAARVALAAPNARERRADESDVFAAGYRVACAELAVVLRAMRRGEPPLPSEIEDARREALELAGMHAEPVPVPPAYASDPTADT